MMFEQPKRFPFLGVSIALIIFALLMISEWAYQEHERLELERYCSNVERHRQTDGAYGWPDYKGSYDEQCPVEGGRQ